MPEFNKPEQTSIGPLAPDTLLRDRYSIVTQAGGGRTGFVYQAQDKHLASRLRAVKEVIGLFADASQQHVISDNFKSRCEVLAQLDHPSIPTIYDSFIEGDRYYLVMNWVSGVDLDRLMRNRQEPVDERLVTTWSIQICDALNYLHRQSPPIVYRDLKPANVMLDRVSDHVMLIDFGLARIVRPLEQQAATEYTPPELIAGNAEPRSDLYSLGATMLHLLTDSGPMDQPLTARDFTTRPRTTPINAEITPEMDRILIQLMAYNPADRPADALEAMRTLSDHYARLEFLGPDTQPLADALDAGEVAGSVGKTVPNLIESIRSSASSDSEPSIDALSFSSPSGALPVVAEPAADQKLCTRCGASFGDNFAFCPYCGQPSTAASKPSDGQDGLEPTSASQRTEAAGKEEERAALPLAAAAGSAPPVVICPNCSHENDSGLDSCESCGEQISFSKTLGGVARSTDAFASSRETLEPRAQAGTEPVPSNSSISQVYDEDVMFTVYSPATVPPDRWCTLLAFAHLSKVPADAMNEPDPIAEVRRQAQQILGEKLDDYKPRSADSISTVPRAGEIILRPFIPDVEFDPSARSFRWEETVHREEFKLRASPSLDGKIARGWIRVYLGPLILAQINLSIRVDGRQVSQLPSQPANRESARPLRKVFASYSHRDHEIVERIEAIVAQSHLGIDYLRDATKLRVGEVWNTELMNMIRDADMFQLFWSWNSMSSKYVRQEVEYALSLGREMFVLPVYWEEPLPERPEEGLPPQELKRIQFEKLSELVRTAPLRTGAEAPPPETTPSPEPKTRGREDLSQAPTKIAAVSTPQGGGPSPPMAASSPDPSKAGPQPSYPAAAAPVWPPASSSAGASSAPPPIMANHWPPARIPEPTEPAPPAQFFPATAPPAQGQARSKSRLIVGLILMAAAVGLALLNLLLLFTTGSANADGDPLVFYVLLGLLVISVVPFAVGIAVLRSQD
jgi:serine/threonine protein kinase